MPNCPRLTEYANRLRSTLEDFDSLVLGMTPEQASWRPAPSSWSVAECIEHLNVTARSYLAGMRPAVERARSRGMDGGAPYGRGTFLGRQVLRVLEPGAGRKFPAPGKFRPRSAANEVPRVWDDFRILHTTVVDLIEEADGLALGRIRFANPAFPLFPMTVAQGFEILSLHAPRHLAQASAVTDTDGYPT